MNRCSQCLIPDTRPDTAFLEGVCSACLAYKARPRIDWQARAEQLTALLARAREVAKARGNHFDVIVASSGGKDSHYIVLQLLERGARVLAVTASTCHLTDIGRKNLDNLARYVTTIEVTPERQRRANLNRLALEMVGDVSWPEHVSIFTTPFKVALWTGIPFIFYGENPQNQYGGPLGSQEACQMTQRWVAEFGGFLGLRSADFETMGYDMAEYQLPSALTLERAGVEAHFLGQYLPWDSHGNAEVARAAGMLQSLPTAANWWEHENLDNAQTGLHDYLMWRKYGYSRADAQLSVDIRSGRLTRPEALKLSAQRQGRFPAVYAGVSMTEVLERIGLSRQELWAILDRFTNWSLFGRLPPADMDTNQPPVLKEQAA